MINLDRLSEIEEIQIIKNFDVVITRLEPLAEFNHEQNSLTWCSDKNSDMLKNITNTNVIISSMIDKSLFNMNCNYIICNKPRLLFQKIINKFFFENDECDYIADTARIHTSVMLGKNAYIGENVVIEKNCIIGDDVRIDHNSVVKKNTVLGDNVVIGSNSVIGGCGFGYERNEDGNYELIPHIGNVVLHDNVEIGQSCCIDRAVLGSTILYENVKTDNFVHIAHGVKIGKNTLLTAKVMIAGSTIIGENVWLSPSVAVMNKIKIGNNALIGIGAVVLKSVEDNAVMVGNPARDIQQKK